ncbi:MAG: class I SAM-dependent methyltransferase [Acidimicrobiales bacterium]
MTPTEDAYFERMWTVDDPWDQEHRFSELRKYRLTVASLPLPHYQNAFEPGCATGLLTVLLAPRCGQVIAMDRHPHAVDVARSRLADTANACVRHGRLPEDWPRGTFDLIVLSEVLYYLSEEGVNETLSRAAATANADAHLVAVHYRPEVEEHALRGDTVDELVASHRSWRRSIHHLEDDFVLTVSVRE